MVGLGSANGGKFSFGLQRRQSDLANPSSGLLETLPTATKPTAFLDVSVIYVSLKSRWPLLALIQRSSQTCRDDIQQNDDDEYRDENSPHTRIFIHAETPFKFLSDPAGANKANDVGQSSELACRTGG